MPQFDVFHLSGFHTFRLDRNYSRGGSLINLLSVAFPHSGYGGLLLLPSLNVLHTPTLIPHLSSFQVCKLNLNYFWLIYIYFILLPTLFNAYYPKEFSSSYSLNTLLASCHPLALFVIGGNFNCHHVMWWVKTDNSGSGLWD